MTGPYEVLIGSSIEKIVFEQDSYVFIEDDLSKSKMFGTMLVTILPPQDLFVPFLQIRLDDGTCVNTLCYSCAKLSNQKSCSHAENKRALTAVYFISEINFALLSSRFFNCFGVSLGTLPIGLFEGTPLI